MKNLFVPYKIAVIAKEKGFNERPEFGMETSLYDKNKEHTFYANYGVMFSDLDEGYIYAPLYAQVVDWFRTKHKIIIGVTYMYEDKDLWIADIVEIKNKYLTTQLESQPTYYMSLKDALLFAFNLI